MTAGFGEVAEQLRRATVQVQVGPVSVGGEQNGSGSEGGSGSGVLWNSTGLIVTNAHVARGSQAMVTLWDGRKFAAEVQQRDEARDLAKLQIQSSQLPAAAIGDSSRLRPGELVVAVGNPLGFIGALTTGVVHDVGPVPGLSRREWVQADVRLAPGNSGGPLADASGRVIGINSMVLSPQRGGGLGLAVPSNAVREFLARGQASPRVGMGVRPVTVRFKQREGPGMVVVSVDPGSPADQASLMIGDVIVGAHGRLFDTWDELSWAIEHTVVRIPLQFLRGDRRQLRETVVQVAVEAQAA